MSISMFLHNAAEPAERFGPKGALTKSLLEKMMSAPPEVNIVCSTPKTFESFFMRGALNVGFTMYEADTMSPAAVFECNRMDAIFVPSAWNKQMFETRGVNRPIFVVNPPMVHFSQEETKVQEERPWTFYSVFEWTTPHKDPTALLTAYFSEFERGENVLLRVKTFERRRDGTIVEEIKALKRRLGFNRVPKMELVTGSLTNEEMWKWYGKADCYVSSHHGEGWGMPIWEAMSLGIPAVATSYSAVKEFMNSGNSFPVKYKLDLGKRWANIDVADLRRAMRETFANQNAAKKIGEQGRNEILANFTAERTARTITDAIETLRKGETCKRLQQSQPSATTVQEKLT